MMQIKKWIKKEPLLAAGALYIALGYALYFAALNIAQPPMWALGWIEDIKPFVKSLRTASRVAVLRNETAFPAQIVILYCAFGMIVFAAWAVWYSTAAQFRERLITAFSGGGYSRFRYVLLGIMVLVLPVFFALVFFFMEAKVLSWRDHVIFSSSLQSASFLLIATAITGFGVVFLIPSVEYAWKGPRNSIVKRPGKAGITH